MAQYFKELVREGFEELHPVMSDFIVKRLKRNVGSRWWDEVLRALPKDYDLPGSGDDADLINCLDKARCCKILNYKAFDFFFDRETVGRCKALSSELLSIRNATSHDGAGDLTQKDAERYLDTMVRMATFLDRRCAERISELYQEARANAPDVAKAAPEGYYPAADQEGAAGAELDLLSISDTSIVEPTGLTRKLTIDGETLAYPVYRVRLDKLFYNDRNDRILTWVSQYKDENGVDDLSGLSREEYNRVIEDFIVKSNPTAIEKTRTNISVVGQRGRVVDGNRRFTCLRMLHRDDPSVNYFETVILSKAPSDDAKQIKLLELAIQHGEEQKVDYNQIDTVLGAWLDIVDTGLITVEEYAASTNESIPEVKKKLDVAQLIVDYLAFMHVPGQYHIAREMQAYTEFVELLPLLSKCKSEEEKTALKNSVFTNTMLGTFGDQRKYIRDLRNLYGTQPYKSYIQRESKAAEQVSQALDAYGVGGMEDLRGFIDSQADTKSELTLSREKALTQSKKAQTRSKPSKNVIRCIELLMEIDTDIFSKLSDEERAALKAQVNKLSDVTGMIGRTLSNE